MQRDLLPLELSIIIPAYNAGRYLKECVQSISCQTAIKYEIIIIDDGSTDDTSELCDEFQKQDSRIKVIHQENSGVSSARNTGMKNAKGTYIMFVDADDTIEKDAFEILAKKLEESRPDILFFGYNLKKLSSENIDRFSIANKNGILTKNIFLDFFAKNRDNENTFLAFNSVCGKLIKKSIAENTVFRTDTKIGEDYLFNLELFLKANSFLFVPECLYNYIKRDNSATTKKREFSDFKDILKSLLNTKEFYAENYLLKYKKYMNIYIHRELYNYLKMYVESGNSLVDLKKLEHKEKRLLNFAVIFANGFHPREILFLLKCKVAAF